MNAKQQLSDFLTWLKNKQTEPADGYELQTVSGKKIYRRMLLLIHAEIVATEQLLKAK